jgi:hypothetical protein
MAIENLTTHEAREIVTLIETQTQTAHPAVGKYVVIRTYSAGVHVGYLVSASGKEVALRDARRIWLWEGAFTLSELSAHGISGGKMSEQIPVIYLTEAIEIIPCSEEAEECLSRFPYYK